MATPSTQRLNCRIVLSYGSSLGSEVVLLDYTEATTTVGFQKAIIPLELAASATDQSVNLASYFDTATFIAVIDRNNTGVLVGRTAGTSARHNLAANGPFVYKNGAATPPTLYFDNSSASKKAFVEIIVMGTSA